MIVKLATSQNCTHILNEQAVTIFVSLELQPPWALASAFQFYDHFTDGRTPWTSDQLVARPLPKLRTTQTQNKHIQTPNIHALCGIRTHDPVAAPQLKRLVAGFPPRLHGFKPGTSQVGFVVDKVEMGQVFSEHFGFPRQSSFHQILHHHNHPGQVQ
jgi:hypothetical protein